MDSQMLKLGYEIFYIQLFHIIAIVLSIALNFMIWLKSRKTQAVRRFMLLQGLFVLWMVAKVLKTVAYHVDLRWNFIVLQYLGVCFIGSVFVMFAVCHGRGYPLNRRSELILNVFPVGMFGIVLTNPWHHLFYATFDFYGDTFGPAFYMHMAFTYGCMAIGIGMILYYSLKSHATVRRNSRMVDGLLGLGILIPLFFNILYITKTFRLFFGARPLFDYTPICYTMSLVVFGFAVFWLDLFGAVKAAALETFNSLSQPAAIVTDAGELHLANAACAESIPVTQLLEHAHGPDYSERLLTMPEPDGKRHYVGSLSALGRLPFRASFRVLTLIDITERMTLAEELGQRNRALETANRMLAQHNGNIEELAIKRERIRAARNMHDILGHALVLVISVLETARLRFSKSETELALERLDAAAMIAREGQEEMNRSLSLHTSGYKDVGFLEDRIRAIADQLAYSGVAVEINVEHQQELIDAEKTETALRAVQEATTNAVRHGRAKTVELYMRTIAGRLVVVIRDDGAGCSDSPEGFGLSQMRSKLEAQGGSLMCSSEAEQGYTLQFSLPL